MTDMQEPIHDVAHLGHVEIFTPKPDESLWFFKELLGMEEVARQGQSVYLRAWGDYDRSTLKLTEAKRAGLGHIGWRVMSPQALERRVGAIKAGGERTVERSRHSDAGGEGGERTVERSRHSDAGGEGGERISSRGSGQRWIPGDIGHGAAYQFEDPDGHVMEIYYESEKYRAPGDLRSALKNQPQKYLARGVCVRRIDHINLMCSNVTPNRVFLQEKLGFKLREILIPEDDGIETGAWLSVTSLMHDIAYMRDFTGTRGRLHHVAYWVDNREDVLRTADILLENNIFLEAGPAKHNISQAFFIYSYEPGGNRIEIYSGGYLIFAPDWEPITWNKIERGKGVHWGGTLPESFRTYGTPVIEAPAVHTEEIPVFDPA